MFYPEGVLSDSEEDLNTTSAWSNARTKSTEQGGDSSDASSERGESVQNTTTL